jgi:polyhydroxybutyrate depolymerase
MVRARMMALASALLVVGACRWPDAQRCVEQDPGAGDDLACLVPGYVDRGYDLRVPRGWDGASPLPLLLFFHGGGGNRDNARGGTCPDGDLRSPDCLFARAEAAGYAVVWPDGTGSRPLRGMRSWNAGGGSGGLPCLGAPACADGVDDLAYVDTLLAEVRAALPIDAARVYATGLSNGAAMAHRLACERPTTFAAIVAVAGAAQHAVAGGTCAGGVPVLQIHGDADPIWPYQGGPSLGGVKAALEPTMEGWRARNGCDPAPDPSALETTLPDLDPADGTTVVRRRYQGCAADTELLRVIGGGHTWPDGAPYLDEDRVGRVSHDISSGEVMAWLEAHRGA